MSSSPSKGGVVLDAGVGELMSSDTFARRKAPWPVYASVTCAMVSGLAREEREREVRVAYLSER